MCTVCPDRECLSVLTDNALKARRQVKGRSGLNHQRRLWYVSATQRSRSMATKTPSESKEAKKLVAKIYKLRDRAAKIAAQAEMLASDSAADRKVAAQAKK